MSVSVLMATSLTTVEAQSENAEASEPLLNLFGISAGVESLPSPIAPHCGFLAGPRDGGSVVAGFVVIPIGRLGLQGRIGYHRQEEILCTLPGPAYDGFVTVDSVAAGTGSFGSLDARLRLAAGVDDRWVFTLGGGWALVPKETAYLATSVGARGGAQVRIGLDLEVALYRVGFVSRTNAYDHGTLVSLGVPEFQAQWEPSFGLRLSLGVPVTECP